MHQQIHSSGGIPRDTVRLPLGDPWATVWNIAEKKRRRPNGDQPLSVQPPRGAPQIIAWRTTGVYKRKLTGWRLADFKPITSRSPLDHARFPTGDRPGICRCPPWTPHSSIKAGLWWMSSQDKQTSRWILLLQFITLTFKYRNNGQGRQEEGQ